MNASYPWQSETNVYLPGGATSVAHQFLRCVLHQLAPNGIFVQMFQTQAEGTMFFLCYCRINHENVGNAKNGTLHLAVVVEKLL